MIDLLNVAKYYKELPHQTEALKQLQAALVKENPNLLSDEAPWVKTWRTPPPESGLLPKWNGGNREQTVKAISVECDRQKLPLITQKAYLVATVEWETGGTFQPVKEAFDLSEDWRRRNLRYYPFYGRGYVQITWEENYRLFGDLLNQDFVGNPDLVLRPDISLFILVHGSKHGLFTGLRIENFIGNGYTDYRNARRVINGTDRAEEIALIAREWEKWLTQNA